MLTIPIDTVGWIIVKAREFEVKEEDSPDDAGDDSNPMSALQNRDGDATESELISWIEDLTDTEQAELVALFWMGRGDGDPSDFAELVEQARSARVGKTSRYLLGEPLLPDYLEEALEALEIDTSEMLSALR